MTDEVAEVVKVDRDSSEAITEPGWYWYDTEYPDEGSAGPYDTRDDAFAAGAEIVTDAYVGVWEHKVE